MGIAALRKQRSNDKEFLTDCLRKWIPTVFVGLGIRRYKKNEKDKGETASTFP